MMSFLAVSSLTPPRQGRHNITIYSYFYYVLFPLYYIFRCVIWHVSDNNWNFKGKCLLGTLSCPRKCCSVNCHCENSSVIKGIMPWELKRKWDCCWCSSSGFKDFTITLAYFWVREIAFLWLVLSFGFGGKLMALKTLTIPNWEYFFSSLASFRFLISVEKQLTFDNQVGALG